MNSDLDISTQEMSEILDRNNYSEVVSPPHFSVHLQRNKSQSISSIGSFCSVSSTLSTHDKIKRSGSQVSLGSLEKTSAPVDQLTDQVFHLFCGISLILWYFTYFVVFHLFCELM